MIEELWVKFPVQECCVALSVSRSGYYQWLAAEQSIRAEGTHDLAGLRSGAQPDQGARTERSRSSLGE